jgi:hypothetical protein
MGSGSLVPGLDEYGAVEVRARGRASGRARGLVRARVEATLVVCAG